MQATKIHRLAVLAGKAKVTVCVDNKKNILQIAEAAKKAGTTVHMYIEYEVGMHRCGVSTFQEFLELATYIESLPHVTFDGIQSYAGQLSHEVNEAYRITQIHKIEKILSDLKEYVEAAGILVKEVSGSSTCTAKWKAKGGIYTEIQAGSYIFMDHAYRNCNLPFSPSLFVKTTVISKNKESIIMDAGVKNFSMDQATPIAMPYPSLPLILSEEHVAIQGKNFTENMGDSILFLTGHCCTTVNTFTHIYFVRNDEVIDCSPIEGRGCSL